MRTGNDVPANPTKTARPIAPTTRSMPTLTTAVTAVQPGPGEPAQPPQVGPDVARREQPEQLGLGVGAHVPPAAEVGVGEGPPAQGAQDVLADDPGEQAEDHRPGSHLRQVRQGEQWDGQRDGDSEPRAVRE